jgi:transcriptional regulator with XRE-family HTH domain
MNRKITYTEGVIFKTFITVKQRKELSKRVNTSVTTVNNILSGIETIDTKQKERIYEALKVEAKNNLDKFVFMSESI